MDSFDDLYHNAYPTIHRDEAAADSDRKRTSDFSAAKSDVRFLKLDLKDAAGKLISTNFYWVGQTLDSDDFTDLNKLPPVMLKAKLARRDLGARRTSRLRLRIQPKTWP